MGLEEDLRNDEDQFETVVGYEDSGQTYDASRAEGLFNNALNPAYRQERDLREYVQGKLIKLAKDKQLFLTDILNHPNKRVAQVAGMIILGHSYKDWNAPIKEQIVDSGLIPPEIARYKVKVKAIGDHGIEWKHGTAVKGYKQKGNCRQPLYAPRIRKTKLRELNIEPKHAWILLKQKGKFCAQYSKRSMQDRYWTVEEVLPPGLTGKRK